MIWPIVSSLIILGILVISEALWRSKKLRGEFGRKFVHITAGTFIAFWPFFMSWHVIHWMSLALVAVITISYHLHIFHAIHNVDRKTWGEILFALAIGAVAAISPTRWIFTAAILHLSLADGLAAVIGSRYGMSKRYKLFGHVRTVLGSLTFLIVSVLIITGTVLIQSPEFSHIAIATIIWVPLMATALENVSIRGSDNLLVPIFIAVVLGSLQLY